MKQLIPQRPIVVVNCDICGKGPAWKCVGCGIDVCDRCGKLLSLNPWTGEDLGDSAEMVCKPCFELMEPLSARSLEIYAIAECQSEELRAEWQRLCKLKKGEHD